MTKDLHIHDSLQRHLFDKTPGLLPVSSILFEFPPDSRQKVTFPYYLVQSGSENIVDSWEVQI